MDSFQVAHIFVAFLCLLHLAQSQYTPICNPDDFIAQSDADTLPSLPDQFYIVVEANFVDNSTTVTVNEYFDSIGNRGRVDISGADFSSTGIFDYNLQEIFLYPSLFTGDECVVFPISTPSDFINRTFGFTMVDGMVHIGSPRTYFESLANESVSRYVGPAVRRGIDCGQWRTCVARENNSYIIDYYFASNWTYSSVDDGIPIPIEFDLMASLVSKSGGVRNYTNIYTFVDFRAGPEAVPDESFMVPTGLACKGRIPGIPLPILPTHFSFSIEFVDPDMLTVGVTREYYDLDQKLFRLDVYYDGSRGGTPGPISFVHDFNLELQYLINHRFANCSIFPLTPESPFLNFDVRIDSDSGLPTLSSPNQIFFLNDEFNYTYEGVTNVRGVDVDSWISVRDFQSFSFQANISDAIFEFYFTRPGWKIGSQISINDEPIPWAGRISGLLTFFNITSNMTESRNFSSRFDFFGYSTEEPSFDIYDVSICISPSEYNVLTMVLPGVEAGMNLGQLRRSIRLSIVDYTEVTPLQVGNIEIIAENGTHIFVSAHISNLTQFARIEPAKNITANNATDKIIRNTGADNSLPFQFELSPGVVVQPFFLHINAGVAVDESPVSRYTGSVIGAIVVMFFIGIAIGVGATLIIICVAYCVRKRKTGSVAVGSAKYEKQEDDVVVS